MKTNKIISFIITFVMFVLVIAPTASLINFNVKSNIAYAAESYETNEGVDFRNGKIKYSLTKAFDDNLNTFEAVIKIEKGESANTLGYVISNVSRTNTLTYAVEVNAHGHAIVHWNSFQKSVEFDRIDLRNGKWTHIAIVRQKQTNSFAFYVNGELMQVINGGVGDDATEYTLKHAIGGDWNTQTATHHNFLGKIKQITIYNRELSQSDILLDYNNLSNISYSTRTGLLFNAILVKGETAYDTSAYRNNATIATNDYYFNGELFKKHDYSLAIIPDTQCIVNHFETSIKYPFNFIINNKEKKNIELVFALGDVTDGYSNNGGKWSNGSGSTAQSRDQYHLIGAQYERLWSEASIPSFAVPGNHDYDNECHSGITQSGTDGPGPAEFPGGIKGHAVTLFDKEFKDTTLSYFAGNRVEQFKSSSIVNTCFFTEYSGIKYMFFALDFGPSDEVIEWAANLTEANPDHRVIVATHGFMNADGDFLRLGDSGVPSAYSFSNDVKINNPQDMWDKWLKKYPNVFMTFSGHVNCDEILYKESVGDCGNIVTNFLIDGQGGVMNDGLLGLVALLDFDESEGKCYINYFDGISNKFYNVQNQFVYDFSKNTTLLSNEFSSNVLYGARNDTFKRALANIYTFKGEEKPNLPLAITITSVGLVAVVVALTKALTNKVKGGKYEE